MQSNKAVDRMILRGFSVLGIGLLAILLRKPPIKDWLLVYLMNAATNGMIDKGIVSRGLLKYPTRQLPNIFKIHILFDYLLYPTLTVAYHQLTAKDKPFIIFLKLFYLTIPVMLIETWAERNTSLIKYNNGWKWYHSFISLSIKSLLTRLWMGGVRKIEDKQNSARAYSICPGSQP